jgi:uncharacterized Zn-finger protein
MLSQVDIIESNDDPICPYCRHIYADWWKDYRVNYNGAEDTITCPICKKTIRIKTAVTYIFETSKVLE